LAPWWKTAETAPDRKSNREHRHSLESRTRRPVPEHFIGDVLTQIKDVLKYSFADSKTVA
jgi:hypothetical protein